MKKISFFTILCVLLGTSLFMTSCKEDVVTPAIVTVRQALDGQYYLQLDQNTTVLPTNSDWSSRKFENVPFRAYVDIKGLKKAGKSVGYDRQGEVVTFYSILTKDLVPTTGNEDLDYVKDGVGSVGFYYNWATNIEDGFLTLNFVGVWGDPTIKHTVNMVNLTESTEKISLRFHNDLNGDVPYDTDHRYLVNGLVAFRLDSLPDTKGATIPLEMHYLYVSRVPGSSISAEKRVANAKYCTGATSRFESVESDESFYQSEAKVD